MNKKILSKVAAFVALGGSVCLGFSGVAMAVDGGTSSITSDTGSLTIHKLVKTPTNGVVSGSGALDSKIQGEPISDVNFEVKQVNTIDLKTNAGWKKVDDVKANGVNSLPSGYTFGAPLTQKTDSKGLATFSNLPIGLYLVTEKLTASQSNVQGIKPFWVTVPITDPTNHNKWVYDVHAYPKNTEHTLTKSTIDASAVKVGDNVQFPIEASLTTLPVESVKITDTLDSKLTYGSGKVELGETTLTVNDDYTITSEGSKVTLELTKAGLDKYSKHAASNPDDKLVFTITAKVMNSGEIANTATLFINNPDENIPPKNPDSPKKPGITVTSNTSLTKFGGIKIHKTGKDGVALPGAKFEVYVSQVNDFSQATKVAEVCNTANNDCTTDDSGNLIVDGLRYSNFADNAEVNENSGKYNFYWVKEVQAPAGYELLPEPVAFKVNSQATSADTLTVNDVEKTKLPLTGSAASLIVMLSAVVLAAGGVLVYAKKASK